MLDPLTALGLAANILAFVDFGSKLLVTSYKTYRSATGTTEENVVLESLVTELKDISNSLAQNTATGLATVTTDELALIDLARDCNKVADDLLDILQDLRVKGKGLYRTMGAVRQTIRATYHKQKIQDLKEHLAAIQSLVDSRLLGLIRSDQSFIKIELNKLVAASTNLHADNIKQLNCVKYDLIYEIEKKSQELNNAYVDVSRQNDAAHLQALDTFSQVLSSLEVTVSSLARQMEDFDKSEKILKNLRFEELDSRQSAVDEHEIEESSYSWIFDQRECNFKEWLRTKSGTFYICGKAGSGKSTLMNFIVRDDKTNECLQEWANGRRLVTANYFFWNAGGAMQKTRKGLLQSLLYHVLYQNPSLIEIATPKRWALDHLDTSHARSWDLKELSQAIRDVTVHLRNDTCFCFFIDGLDEYDGFLHDLHKDIADLTNFSSIKICFSSRPRNIFDDLHAQSDQQFKIVLQNHTQEAIRKFINVKFAQHDKFESLAEEDARKLISQIRSRASGVFLWVFLVVQDLLVGLYEDDSFVELQERLQRLPDDLDHLFGRILLRVDSLYKPYMSRMLLIVADIPEPLPLSAACFVYDEARQRDAPLHSLLQPVEPEVLVKKREKTKADINKWCRDLLEVNSKTDRITFSHRTIKDYIQLPDVQQSLRSHIEPDFDTSCTCAHLFLCWIKSLPSTIALQKGMDEWYHFHDIAAQVLAHAQRFESRNGIALTDMLDELDKVCSSLYGENHPLTVHWTNSVRFSHRNIEPVSWESSFLAYAAAFSLKNYLSIKLDDYGENFVHSSGPCLLDSALRDVYFRPHWAWSPHGRQDLIQLLLEKGVDVNEVPTGLGGVPEVHHTFSPPTRHLPHVGFALSDFGDDSATDTDSEICTTGHVLSDHESLEEGSVSRGPVSEDRNDDNSSTSGQGNDTSIEEEVVDRLIITMGIPPWQSVDQISYKEKVQNYLQATGEKRVKTRALTVWELFLHDPDSSYMGTEVLSVIKSLLAAGAKVDCQLPLYYSDLFELFKDDVGFDLREELRQTLKSYGADIRTED